MKKILFTLILIGVLASPISLLAAWTEPGHPTQIAIGDNWETKILDGAKKAIKAIWTVIVVAMFIYAAVLFATSSGDPEKMSKAKKAFIYGVIGVGVGLLGYSGAKIIDIMKDIFGLTTS